MEFKCSSCSYCTPYKISAERHINKQKKCGQNPSIVEVPSVIVCEYCNKSYASRDNLTKHYKICEIKESAKKEDLKKEIQRLEIENKSLKSRQMEELPMEEKYNSIYLVHEREFLNLQQPVYKIGITETINRRMRQYPKGSKIIFVMPVDEIQSKYVL